MVMFILSSEAMAMIAMPFFVCASPFGMALGRSAANNRSNGIISPLLMNCLFKISFTLDEMRTKIQSVVHWRTPNDYSCILCRRAMRIDWQDIRVFQAVVRHGSCLAAAAELGLNHTTVARRVKHLEDTVGVVLGVSSNAGFRPTDAGRRLAGAADDVYASVADFSRVARGLRQTGDVVLVQAPEGTVSYVLTPLFSGRLPVSLPESLPLVRVISDQAPERAHIRVVWSPGDGEPVAGRSEVGEHVTDMAFFPYSSRRYLESEPQFDRFSQLKTQPLLSVSIYAALRLDPWLELVYSARRSTIVDWTPALAAPLLSGAGIALLPAYADGVSNQIIRLDVPCPPMRAGIWLVADRDELRTPSVRAVYDTVKAALSCLCRAER